MFDGTTMLFSLILRLTSDQSLKLSRWTIHQSGKEYALRIPTANPCGRCKQVWGWRTRYGLSSSLLVSLSAEEFGLFRTKQPGKLHQCLQQVRINSAAHGLEQAQLKRARTPVARWSSSEPGLQWCRWCRKVIIKPLDVFASVFIHYSSVPPSRHSQTNISRSQIANTTKLVPQGTHT